jgi:ubiquinone/menaquinone biosynthesis C-methylase UbiE
VSTSSQADWDSLFEDFYLSAYEPRQAADDAETEAFAAVRLAGVEPGARILDCPCGYGRHSIALARAGYRVVGLDRSGTLLGEARRRGDFVGDVQFVQGDYRELPFGEGAFDALLCLFSSLGYYGPAEDAQALREFERVLRPGGRLVVEIMTRDRLVRVFQPRDWRQFRDGSLHLEEREFDPVTGIVAVTQTLVGLDGSRGARSYRIYVYTPTELVAIIERAASAPSPPTATSTARRSRRTLGSRWSPRRRLRFRRCRLVDEVAHAAPRSRSDSARNSDCPASS